MQKTIGKYTIEVIVKGKASPDCIMRAIEAIRENHEEQSKEEQDTG